MLYMPIEDMASYALHYSPSFKGRNKPTIQGLIKLAQEDAPSNKVGWEGNFNDMALKTVLRRLISKYGYLSVEMQNAVISDVNSEQTEAIRNDEIADTEVVEIDTDADEIQEVEPQEQEKKANETDNEEPPY